MMTIAEGSRLPSATLKMKVGEQVTDVKTDDYFAGKKVVLFGVPGAFTGTCSRSHLPGFIQNYDAIRAKGVDKIAVMAVNDQHVMGAWAQASGGEGKIDFLADGNAAFAKALGLDVDLSGGGMGIRVKRFSAIVEDGVLKKLNIEEVPGQVTNSGGEAILKQL
jgi:peroxiredoxin